MIWPFRRAAAPAAPAPTIAADHGRALAQLGHQQRRAKYRATARAICAARGMPVPAALEN